LRGFGGFHSFSLTAFILLDTFEYDYDRPYLSPRLAILLPLGPAGGSAQR
jgi:hypothetical protein